MLGIGSFDGSSYAPATLLDIPTNDGLTRRPFAAEIAALAKNQRAGLVVGEGAAEAMNGRWVLPSR